MGPEMIICPKCGYEQYKYLTECEQCGIIFSKIKPEKKTEDIPRQQTPVQKEIKNIPKRKYVEDKFFEILSKIPKHLPRRQPSQKPKSPLEITILYIMVYIHLCCGIFIGVFVIVRFPDIFIKSIGIGIIFEAIVVSMVLFIVCLVSRNILFIRHDISSLLNVAEKHSLKNSIS